MSAGWGEACAAIIGTFRAEWVVDGAPRCPVEYPNQPAFQPPDGPWVRLSMQLGVGRRMNIGRPARLQYTGFVAVQVFVPRQSGDGASRTLQDAAAAIFAERTIQAGGAIRFLPPSFQQSGQSDRWWIATVTCPFQRDRSL